MVCRSRLTTNSTSTGTAKLFRSCLPVRSCWASCPLFRLTSNCPDCFYALQKPYLVSAFDRRDHISVRRYLHHASALSYLPSRLRHHGQSRACGLDNGGAFLFSAPDRNIKAGKISAWPVEPGSSEVRSSNTQSDPEDSGADLMPNTVTQSNREVAVQSTASVLTPRRKRRRRRKPTKPTKQTAPQIVKPPSPSSQKETSAYCTCRCRHFWKCNCKY